jgi:hypothetical protein
MYTYILQAAWSGIVVDYIPLAEINEINFNVLERRKKGERVTKPI